MVLHFEPASPDRQAELALAQVKILWPIKLFARF
jgi:hypothetical protein